MNITVLGCGRWGSFIAWYLNKIGKNVILWGRENSSHMKELIATRKNKWLNFDKKITFTTDLNKALSYSKTIVISISAQSLGEFLENIKSACTQYTNKTFVLCMKGIEEETCRRLSEVVKFHMGDVNSAVWVGPGHVQDFSNDIPNCMIIDSENKNITKQLVSEFSSPLIRFYYGTDLIGTEIGAAAKNVIGIAAGILDGLGFESLKGALMSRGAYEISQLIQKAGGNALSAYGLAHLGDYQATLFSPHSNNRKFGESLALGQKYSDLAEGAYTSCALIKMGEALGVELPICSAVNTAIERGKVDDNDVRDLFIRKIKHEF